MSRWQIEDAESRFLRYVTERDDGCWQWIGANTEGRYGQFNIGVMGKSMRAHRWAYEHWVGPIPEGLEVDHVCNNGLCVNPTHLEPVTTTENHLRMSQRRGTCQNGLHPYPGPGKLCKPCNAAKSARWRQRQKE